MHLIKSKNVKKAVLRWIFENVENNWIYTITIIAYIFFVINTFFFYKTPVHSPYMSSFVCYVSI